MRIDKACLALGLIALCACADATHEGRDPAAHVADASSDDAQRHLRLAAHTAPSGVVGRTLCLNAPAPSGQDVYQHIESVFGAGAVEAPSDVIYTPVRRHILALADDGVVGAHFAVLAIEPSDVNLDRVPDTSGGDRSRTEIKIAPSKGGAHDAFKAHQGDTYIYTWRFRIAAGMKFSPSFTHIHQIKAQGGIYADPPLITFTVLSDGNLYVRHVGDLSRNASESAVLGSMSLDRLLGQWMDVREEIVYSNTLGRYRLSIRDQQGVERLSIDKSELQLWRTGADHMRPKWGIYRKHHPLLNQHIDDYLYLANFGITRGETPDSACR